MEIYTPSRSSFRRIMGSWSSQLEASPSSLTRFSYSNLWRVYNASLSNRSVSKLPTDRTSKRYARWLRATYSGAFFNFRGSALTVHPEPSVLGISENRLSRWQLIRQITERFWKIWQSDYVNTLQQWCKWRTERPSIKIGTMVLIKNQLLPPCKWELGRVTQCHPGPDSLVRVVSIRTAQSEYKRPLVKVCVLPVKIDSQLNNEKGD